MDVFIPIVIFVIAVIIFSICGFCCKRKQQGTVYGPGTNVTVCTQPVSASPVVVPPYPVDPRHPTPHQGAPAPGIAPYIPPYPMHNPHPTTQAQYYYYPPPVGAAPYPPMMHPTPYPPAGPAYPDYSAQPPSYSEAVAQPPPIQPPLPAKEGYAKQAPYNPHY